VKTDDIHDTALAEALLAAAGTFPDFPTNDEIEADDALYENRMEKRRAGKLCKP
jgi:hypothetical protein